MNKPRGIISPIYFVNCGVCGTEINTFEENRVAAADFLRSVGWIWTDRKGWICQHCPTRSPLGVSEIVNRPALKRAITTGATNG